MMSEMERTNVSVQNEGKKEEEKPEVCSTLVKISLLALFGLFNTMTN